MEDLARYERFALATAKKVGNFLLQHLGDTPSLHYKAHHEVFSKIDVGADRLVATAIKKYFPTHSILSEELAPKTRIDEKAMTWVVDPLDGTSNYLMGVPLFATQMALARGRSLLVGVLGLPVSREYYLARRKGGAWLDRERLITSSQRNLKNARLLFCFGTRPAARKLGLRLLGAINRFTHHVKMYGAASVEMATVARGGADGFLLCHTTPWDIAPGALLVREAGGKVTDHRGRDWELGRLGPPVLVVLNGKIHNELLRLAQRVVK